MRLTVIGLGYVGLVTGSCLAESGNHVTLFDVDDEKVANLRALRLPLYEPDLEALMARNIAAKKLHFTSSLLEAIHESEVIFLTVGTPSNSHGRADLSQIEAATRAIAKKLDSRFRILALKSTVPINTAERVAAIIAEEKPDADVAIASNPEFLSEGAAIHNFMKPDRIVIGTDDERAQRVFTELYAPFCKKAPVFFTQQRTAELVKYASNAFLATRVAFINELADLCESLHVDVKDVAALLGMDPRIGPLFLRPGPGYGGSCFPKDVAELSALARDYKKPLRILDAAIDGNAQRPELMRQKIAAACGGSVKGKTLACLGLTFKPETNDVRESPALRVIDALLQDGANIRAFDPKGMDAARGLLNGATLCDSIAACASTADALIILTDWKQFAEQDLALIATRMRAPLLIDLRNIFTPDVARRAGFTYEGVGVARCAT